LRLYRLAQFGIEDEVSAEAMEVVLGFVDMLDHELPYPARCGEEAPMRRHIGIAELLIVRMVRLQAHRHHVAQQAVGIEVISDAASTGSG
jgi:hypothetical protein